MRKAGRYVLCWLQQALRARDKPAIDAQPFSGNEFGLPVLVYHRLREDHRFAPDRVQRCILGEPRSGDRLPESSADMRSVR